MRSLMKNLTAIALSTMLAFPVLAENMATQLPAETNSVEAPVIEKEMDADAIAKELSNPATSLASLNFNFETYAGDDGFQKQVVSFQPAFPVKLSPTTTLAVRPLFGMTISEDATGETETNFNNIGLDLMYGKTFKTGTVLLGGLYLNAPTSSADGAQDNWVGGPEMAAVQILPRGVVGALVFHATDLNDAPEDGLETDITNINYFYAMGLGNGWQLAAGPTATYNWNFDEQVNENPELELESAWAVPIGVGLSKTVVLGSTPLKMSAEAHYYIEKHRESDADFLIKFKIAPVVNNPLQSLFN